MPIREVQGVPIVAWLQPDAVQSAPAELRGFFSEREGVERLLLDLSAVPDLNASSMEALTEAFRVCADRKARVGMFGLNFSTLQLIEILGLHTNLPPHMGETEDQAVATITSNGAAPPPPPPPQQELTFEVPPAAGGVELEFDLESEPATKKPVDLEFDLDVGTAPTARFDPAQVAQATGTSVDVGLTTILWNDLASQGYVIGGAGADEIMAAAASTQVAAAPAADPAAAPAGAPAGAPGIDFGDLEPAGGVSTQDGSDEGASWTAAPAAPAGAIDFSSPTAGGIDFGAPPADPGAFGAPAGAGAFGAPQTGGAFGGAAMVSSGLFGSPPAGDFSPVDSGGSSPPAAVAPAAAPMGAPVPGGMGGIAPDDDVPDDSNETIMFAPGALDQALAEAAAKAAAENAAAPDPTPAAPPEPVVLAAEPTPVAPAPAPAAPEQGSYLASDSETVMIQPGMLDQALLAEVAKAAGEETALPPPPVEEPKAAPPPATNTAPTGDELAVRLFVLDQGIKSDLHIEVLGRLLKFEKVVGPEDLKVEGDVRGVLDQFAQNRLLRRQRSARVRGGNGFVLSASPAARGTVTRLWRMWSNPQGRAKLSAWVREG
jgi:anti-anti-sigma regulatory factor